MKKIFKIELIFIYTALAIFFCTIFFKRASNNLIQKLDTEMLLLQMDPKSIVADCDDADIFSENPVDFESIALKLRSDYQAFTYFDAPLKKKLKQTFKAVIVTQMLLSVFKITFMRFRQGCTSAATLFYIAPFFWLRLQLL